MPKADESFDDLVAIVEISAGSDAKLEFNETSGSLELDRTLAEGLRYPVNYGTIPGTLAADGDALDVLVLNRLPLPPGTVVTVRPIALLCMRDSGREDSKVIAVPSIPGEFTMSPPPAAAPPPPAKETLLLPKEERARIEDFFRRYKNNPDVPPEKAPVQIDGWGDAHAARAAIARGIAAYVGEGFQAGKIPVSS